jgi:hypothetical protein
VKCIPFGPPIIYEKEEFWGRSLGKAYGIKVWCYLEHLGGKTLEAIENQIIQRTSHQTSSKQKRKPWVS